MALALRLFISLPRGLFHPSPCCLHALTYTRMLCMTTPTKGGEEDGGSKADVFDAGKHIRQQMLLAGLSLLKGDVERLKENVSLRAAAANVDKLLSLHLDYKNLLQHTEKLRHERNQLSQHFSHAKTKEERDEVTLRGSEVKRDIARLEAEMLAKEKELVPELALIPNASHPDAPVGGYEQSRVVLTNGTKPEFQFPVKNHVEIGEKLDILDFSSAAQASGHSFYYLKGAAAMLEMALIQYTLQKAVAKGYLPVTTPDIVKTDVVEGCGFHPRSTSTQVYTVTSHHGHHCLSGTAEIPLAGMFMEQVIPVSRLPKRLVAYGRCFRAESGGYGRAVRGLYRVHQFSKVELFGLTASEEEERGKESERLLEEMVQFQQEICSELGFHFRLLDMATEELGTPAYRKYDIEVWMPGRGEYGEVTSASNCTDFQSRRLRITYPNPAKRHRTDPGRKYVHTVNGTACAIPRTILALLENYQQVDGSVVLPEALHPYLPREHWHIRPVLQTDNT